MTPVFSPSTHLLMDFYDAKNLQDQQGIETVMRQAATACGATVLHVLLHNFGEHDGITGVAILAESHISIHTWPETGYVALDIFVCGDCDAHKALPILQNFFKPARVEKTEHVRGQQIYSTLPDKKMLK